MAGGMNKRGGGIPMSQRVRLASGVDASCPARHCWIADGVDRLGVRRPGLLVEWRQVSDGCWEGRVVYVAALRSDRWALVEEWVAADRLTPTSD